MGCFKLQDIAALSGRLVEQGFTEKGNKQLEKQEAEKPHPGTLAPISREVCQELPSLRRQGSQPSAVLGSLGAPESRPPHRRGRGLQCLAPGRLGELLASQLPQEHGPLQVPPGVARVMGSRGKEHERPVYKCSFSQNGVWTPCSEQKRLLGGTPCPGTPELPRRHFRGLQFLPSECGQPHLLPSPS